MNAARWLDETRDLRVEETAVTVGRLFSPKGYTVPWLVRFLEINPVDFLEKLPYNCNRLVEQL